MICRPGTLPGVASLRVARPSEADAIQAIWESSNTADDPAGWTRGAWSAAWATHTSVLELDGQPVGVAAVRAEVAPDGAMPARVALDAPAREPLLAEQLVRAAVDVVHRCAGPRARLVVPAAAGWARAAADRLGFRPVRTIAHMLLPAAVPTPAAELPASLRLRAIRGDEDETVLAALNLAWTGTWNFVPITLQMLQEDLEDQRDGMLLAVDAADRIVATCHAVYEPHQANPDGDPRAWISNVTVVPTHRNQGISRAMLAAGIAYLRERGAGSIRLDVDADNPAPYRLYLSVGFQVASTLEAWDSPAIADPSAGG